MRRLIGFDAPSIAIPFGNLTPKIDDLVLERGCKTLRRFVDHVREGQTNTAALLLRDGKGKRRMPAAAHRTLDMVDALLPRR